MEFKKFECDDEASKFVANIIINAINSNKNITLGFATGSTPIKLYKELVNDHVKNDTDWSNVTTFNLDEYLGLEPNHEQSYKVFMNNHLFSKVNIPSSNINFPSVDIQYDDLIKSKGGIDIQILGIGTNGHIGFNEPGSNISSLTRIVDLSNETIQTNATKFFNGSVEDFPKKAISMGIKSILNTKKIILLAFGNSKQEVIKKLKKTSCFDKNFPASSLIFHDDVTIIFDNEANENF